MNLITFADKFCAQRNIRPEDYENVVLRLSLRPPARWLRWLLAIDSSYFVADRELVRGVGRISRLRDFETEAMDFAHHPENRGFLRQTLQLRVSTRRLLELVRVTLHDGKPSADPFGPTDAR